MPVPKMVMVEPSAEVKPLMAPLNSRDAAVVLGFTPVKSNTKPEAEASPVRVVPDT